MHITKNLEDLRRRISVACAAAGRNESEVTILAVSKRHSIASIGEAFAAGLHSMGENYVQEALGKIPQCPPDIEWHFIGRIQTNKTKALAGNFQWVQTVSSQQIAERLDRQRPEELGPLNVCVQVDTDSQGQHGGIPPQDAAELCGVIARLPRLRLRGLMTVPLPAATQGAQREPFRRLRELQQQLNATGFALDTLSMGMTGDLEAAVLEGSTLVRVGTALFGPRPA
jgi:pyridoxal phosphate enzyme (YggS family)